MLGGPTNTFLEHFSTDKLIEDLTVLQSRLVDLSIEFRNDRVFLADFKE
jgi:hypothetical protein